MLAVILSTPVVLLQMSECSIFVFAVIFPVLTHIISRGGFIAFDSLQCERVK